MFRSNSLDRKRTSGRLPLSTRDTVVADCLLRNLGPNSVSEEIHILRVVRAVTHHKITPGNGDDLGEGLRSTTPEPSEHRVALVTRVVSDAVVRRRRGEPLVDNRCVPVRQSTVRVANNKCIDLIATTTTTNISREL